ncbi:Prenylcysteine oxidase [Nymphon striatum]|nr:Prenylcysteine oxidase [Nymphon striatum]
MARSSNREALHSVGWKRPPACHKPIYMYTLYKMNVSFCITILIALKICITNCQHAKKAPNIAVVGGGIGGASASYFLNQLFSTPQFGANIHLYEGKAIGGRLAVVNVGNHDYESGGSVIHSRNKYMVDFAKFLGLTYEKLSSDGKFGIYNGKKYVFKSSGWEWVTLLKMFWRYGLDIYRLKSLVTDMINKLSRIYIHQNDGVAFTSVEKLMNSMDKSFANFTTTSLEETLKNAGYGDLIISELVAAATRTNYGQNTNSIQGFVGLVAIAGFGFDLWDVKEGNYKVPELLIKRSNAKVIQNDITSIELLKDSQYLLRFSENESRLYDIVIIATPLTKDLCNIKFSGFPSHIAPEQGTYHRTVATFVQGSRNLKAINLKDANIDSILTVAEVKQFTSFSELQPINAKNSGKPVYKIFSQKPLTEAELDYLFLERSETKVVDWLAYPDYEIPQPLGKFVLHEPGLYYTNAIEKAASAMEMSAISGRNAALLAYNKWFKKNSKINLLDNITKEAKSEL